MSDWIVAGVEEYTTKVVIIAIAIGIIVASLLFGSVFLLTWLIEHVHIFVK